MSVATVTDGNKIRVKNKNNKKKGFKVPAHSLLKGRVSAMI